MSDTSAVAARFSRAASNYSKWATVQRRVAERLIELLPEKAPKTVLEIGCGTGTLTELIRQRLPQANITAIDIAPQMVAAARLMPWAEGIDFYCLDARSLDSFSGFELVVSSSAIHWIQPYRALFEGIYRTTEEGGCLLYGAMSYGTLAELHELRTELFPSLPPRKRLPSGEHLVRDVEAAGFDLEHNDEQRLEERFPDIDRFVRSLRELGVTGGDISHADRLLTRSELRRLFEQYKARYTAPNGEVRATYQVNFVRARRAVTR